MTTGSPKLAVLDYGIGNLRSAQKALQKVGADAELTADPKTIEAADGVVLPGVGAFGACMAALHDHGLADLAAAAASSGRPFLGVCVGMQLMYEHSEENPEVDGLGILPGWVRLLPDSVKRPQMQWNELSVAGDSVLFDGLDGAWVYFVHSYAAAGTAGVVATCDYGGPVAAGIEMGSVMATQFHPEKSGPKGLQLLANFVAAVGQGATA